MAIGHAAESRIRKSIRREVNSSLEKPAELPHYLLVTIGKSPVTQDFQMAVFDTHADQIVGNNIYDLKTTPRASATVKFDTYTTQYVGNGTIVQ